MTIAEVLVATAIATGLVVTLAGVAEPLQGMFDGQLELADMHQRIRAGAHAIERHLLAARPPVLPYRAGARRSDPELGIYYRDDTITLVSPSDDGAVTLDTYYLRPDAAAGTSELMHYDGLETDAPAVSHVVALAFEYFGADGLPLDPAALQDGPWTSADAATGVFDADLLRIRRVRLTLRVQAARTALRGPAGVLFTHGGTATSMARYLPDRVIRVDVAPRNLDAE